jgi:hypothetical protein
MVSTVRWSCIGRVTSKLDFSPLPCKTAAIDAQRYQFATKNSTRGAELVGINPKVSLAGDTLPKAPRRTPPRLPGGLIRGQFENEDRV